MNNLIDIQELRKQVQEKKSVEDWKAFSEMQNGVIEQYQKQIDLLKIKNNNLENIILKKYQSNLITELPVEEKICIEQINRLEKVSTDRQLTLEEVKRLDLLVKNLKLIREESTIVVNNKMPDNYKEADLVAIAAQSEDNT